MGVGHTRVPRWGAFGLAAGLVAALAPGAAFGTNISDFTVIPATGGEGIPAWTAGGAWRSLTGPVIDVAEYSNPDTIAPNALVFQLQLPANFEWDTARTTAPTVAVAPGMPAGSCALTATAISYWSTPGQNPVYRNAQFGLSGTHDIGCRVTVAGLQLRPVSSDPAAGTGGTIAVSWTLSGQQSTPQDGGTVAMVVTPLPVVTPATGGTNIPASTAGGAWTTLSGPTIAEGTSGQLSAAQIVLTLPANFEFNTNVTAPPDVSCGYPVSGISYFGSGNRPTNAKVTLTGHATMTQCSIAFGKILQVRPVSADPAAGTGGNMTVSVDGSAVGNGGAISMATTAPGKLSLTITSPTMNNNAIIWGQSYIDIKTSGTPGTKYQTLASTDNVNFVPLKDSSGAVIDFTIGSGGSYTYRYTPIRNYWYKSVAGSTASNVWRITVRQTCAISPAHSGTVTVAAGSKITFTTTSRPARSDLPTANVKFEIWQKNSSGAWVLHSSVMKPINAQGQVQWPVTFSTKGSYYVRAQTQPTSVNSNSFWTPNQYYNVS